MLRGTHKQIVVIQEFENKLFEQAIFILKPDALKDYKKNPDDVLREARKVVDNYAQRNGVSKIKPKALPPADQFDRRKRYVFLSLGITCCILLFAVFFLFLL